MAEERAEVRGARPYIFPENQEEEFHRLVNNMSMVKLVNACADRAEYQIQGEESNYQQVFQEFDEFIGPDMDRPPYFAWREGDTIFVEVSTVKHIFEFVRVYIMSVVAEAGEQTRLRYNPYFYIGVSQMTNPDFSKYVVCCVHSKLRGGSAPPNFVLEVQYSHHGDETRAYRHMAYHLAQRDVMAGIIVTVNYPWNFENHEDNAVVLLYYQKEVHLENQNQGEGSTGFTPPRFALVLSRALTATEIDRLVVQAGIPKERIRGFGIPEATTGRVPGRCWYANPLEDDVYTFAIPGSLLAMPAYGVMKHTVRCANGSERVLQMADLDGTWDVVINCKMLMRDIVRRVGIMDKPKWKHPIDSTLYDTDVW